MRVLTARATPVAFAVLLGCQPAAPSFTEQDAAQVRAIFDSAVAHVRAADWTAWAAPFAEDARFHPSNGPALVGRAAILAWAQALPPIEAFSFHDVQVAGEGNMAYGSSAIVIKMRDLPADTAKQLVVMRRATDGAWQVQAVSVTSDLPLPGAGPPPQR